MTPERWQQVKSVFDQAAELAPDQRSSFLDSACSTDHSLRREVESLLSSNNDVRTSFLGSSPNAELRLSKGTRLGDFEILSLLGAGGMGEVYRARDYRLERDVAIKVLPRFLSFDRVRLRRFELEAKAAAALNHPNILAVFHLGTYEDAPYFVSELLEGETLRARLKLGPPPKATDYAMQIACGLEAAHERGIVHRDLKPENLFITNDGRVKILDFGLAKLSHQVASQSLETEPGAVLGTVGYMSPEQVRGLEADDRADIFSFGAILYEMLSGRRAFAGETSADTMSAVLNKQPESISRAARNVPRAVEKVLRRCLEKNPDQRFQSARELVAALRLSSESRPSPFAFPSPKAIRRTALVAGMVLAFSALIILGFKIAGPKSSSKRSTGVSAGKAGYVPSFTQTSYDVGSQPDSVVVGDFNSDGKLDLAVANAGDGTVSVLLGKGDGTFQSTTQYTVGPAGLMSQIAVGDFNADGELDLVVTNFGNHVSVLLGNGNGTFRAAGSYDVATNPSSVAIADLNGDGKLDLVVSNQNCNNGYGPCGPGTVSVLLGNGDGTFQAHRDFSTSKGPNWIAVGDFNGDGKLDLAVACGSLKGNASKLSILLGNGDGTFLAPVSYELYANGDSVAAADFNGDGKLDLAVVDNVGVLSIFLGNGDGTFRPRVDYSVGFAPWGSIGVGDFNGDGNLDLAVANTGPNLVTILTGKGDGTFLSLLAGSLTGLNPNGVAVGDFRRNGKLDLAVPVRSSNVVSILLQ